MIVLHVAPINWQELGGLSVSIPALVASQNRLDGVEAALVVSVANPATPPEMVFPVFDQKIALDRNRRLNLPAPFDRPDLVAFHSTYIPAHARIAAALRKAAIPYVICPRGGMTRRAQRRRRWKKHLGNLLFFNKMVAHAASLHCLTTGEAEQLGRWNRPVFIVGNGVRVPDRPASDHAGVARPLTLLFIGRLAIRHKGLDTLLQACALVRFGMLQRGARIELCGPDWRGNAARLSAMIAELNLEDVVALRGPVVGDAKTTAFDRANAFIHTSRWEGHPMAVLEALAHGVPCLVTPETNVADEIAAARAGWKVQRSAAGIAAGLAKILAADHESLQRAGANARRLAFGQYDWGHIAARTVQAYRRLAA